MQACWSEAALDGDWDDSAVCCWAPCSRLSRCFCVYVYVTTFTRVDTNDAVLSPFDETPILLSYTVRVCSPVRSGLSPSIGERGFIKTLSDDGSVASQVAANSTACSSALVRCRYIDISRYRYRRGQRMLATSCHHGCAAVRSSPISEWTIEWCYRFGSFR